MLKWYTVIYVEGWMSGSHYHSLTRCTYVEAENVKALYDRLMGNGIDSTQVVFIFNGKAEHCGESI